MSNIQPQYSNQIGTNRVDTLPDSMRWFVKTSAQTMELLSRLDQVFTGKTDTVDIQLPDSTGKLIQFTVPTVYSFHARVQNLNQSIRALNDQVSGTQDWITESGKISGLGIPTGFKTRANFFLESMLNPLLYISLPLKGKIAPTTTRFKVLRILPKPDTEAKRAWLTRTWIGKSEIDYDSFISELRAKSIRWVEDIDTRELEPGMVRASGTFGVVSILPGYPERETKYILTTIEYNVYTDSGEWLKSRLKPGDLLETGGTVYMVTSSNQYEDSITVKAVSGTAPIQIGVDQLQIVSKPEKNTTLEIPVMYNEYQAVFIKEIESRYGIISKNWSSGVAFYSNDLVTQTPTGAYNLSEYYQKFVTDYSIPLLNSRISPHILLADAKRPNSPVLTVSDFSVVKINDHINNKDTVDRLAQLINKKIEYTTKIDVFNEEIATLFDEYQQLQLNRPPMPNTPARYQSARIAVSSNIANLSTIGTQLDGVTLVLGDLILLRGQTTATQNGVYIVSSVGVLTRIATGIFASGQTVVGTDAVRIAEGSAANTTLWVNTVSSVVVNSGTLTFTAQVPPSVAAISDTLNQIEDYNQKLSQVSKWMNDRIAEKGVNSQLLKAIINELKNYDRTVIRDPKYRVRGFWAIPQPIFSDRTGFQHVVQFIVSYRYVSGVSGQPASVQQLQMTENGVNRNVYFSPWNETETKLRARTYNEALGQWIWDSEQVDSAEETNSNQLDIPISAGESVEIRIRSVSEAGWPIDKHLSDWSNTIRVDFPQGISDTGDVDILLKNLESESLTLELKQQAEVNLIRIAELTGTIQTLQQTVSALNARLEKIEAA
jgi:hypothetical protein